MEVLSPEVDLLENCSIMVLKYDGVLWWLVVVRSCKIKSGTESLRLVGDF